MDASAGAHGPGLVSASARPPVIELDAVGRRYAVGDTEVVALDDIALGIAPGEFVVVLGPSGSGKSTLLNVIGALDTPTSGRIVIAGTDITRASRRDL